MYETKDRQLSTNYLIWCFFGKKGKKIKQWKTVIYNKYLYNHGASGPYVRSRSSAQRCQRPGDRSGLRRGTGWILGADAGRRRWGAPAGPPPGRPPSEGQAGQLSRGDGTPCPCTPSQTSSSTFAGLSGTHTHKCNLKYITSFTICSSTKHIWMRSWILG